jgi:hypothetical protein
MVVLAMAAFWPLVAAAQDISQPPALPSVNDITQAVVQEGALSCAKRVDQVTSFLGYKSNSGAVLMVPPNQPDQRLFPLAMEVTTNAGSAYVSATFAPNQVNGCGASYDAVMYWPQNCATVAAMQFGTIRKVGQLGRTITVLDGGVATKIFLMPAGGGCVSIKKEMVL